MKAARIAHKLVNYIYYLLKFGSPFLAYAFAFNNVPHKLTANLRIRNKFLVLKNGERISLPIKHLKRFNTPQLGYLIYLLNNEKISIASSDADQIIFKIGNLFYPVKTPSNLSVLNELISDHYYNIIPPVRCTLLDIGMNVGYASLYFSKFENIQAIYAFEPFEDTCKIASTNFELNGAFGKKVKHFSYGISNYTGSIDVPLLEGGSVIASTEKSFIENHKISSQSSIQVRVRDILEVLDEVEKDFPGQPIAMKVDCEGEEYNILTTMDNNNRFGNICFLCIEWHFKGPEQIQKILIRNGFTVFDTPKSEVGEFGMIYGFKYK